MSIELNVLTLALAIGNNARLSVYSRSERVQSAQMSQAKLRLPLRHIQLFNL